MQQFGPIAVLLVALTAGGCTGSVSGGEAERSDAASNPTLDSGADDADPVDAAVSTTPDAAQTGSPDAAPAPEPITFFFGYFTYDPSTYLAEMDGHCNVVLGWSTFEVIEDARSRGIRPIVWLATILQLWDSTASGLVLKSNYLEIWNAYAAQLAPYIDDIYGFYPADEPFWAAGLSVADQNALNTAIKASFPDKPILTTFARPTIDDSSFTVPATYDIVSYDQYGASFDEDKAGYELLKSKLSPGQKMFLLGDAFVPDFSVTDEQQWLRANKIYQAYDLATTPGEPIVGILSFVWDGFSQDWPGTSGPYYIGLRDMPIAMEHFNNVADVAIAYGGGG